MTWWIAILGIPMHLRFRIEDLIPDEMQILIDEHHSKRPRSCKPLIDMTFAGNDHRDVAWNLLDDDEREEQKN